VVLVDRLGHEIVGIAADPGDGRRALEPEAVLASTVSVTVVRRTSSRENVSSKKRTNGPIEQEALLSFALERRSAERPSKSRRLTSLPRVAPTMRPRPDTTRTTSGSGLFQVDLG